MAKQKYSDIIDDWNTDIFYHELDMLENPADQFSMMWNDNKRREKLSVSLVKSDKSETEANRLRNEGNSFYKKKNFVRALELYNHSIMHAPHPVVKSSTQMRMCDLDCDPYDYPTIDPERYGGTVNEENETLAKGYANRSALLYEIKCYDKCLADIDLAIETGCSEGLRKRLASRKEKCFKGLKENISSKEDFNAIISRLKFHLNEGDDSIDEITEREGRYQEQKSLYCKLHNKHLVDILSLQASNLLRLKESNPSHPTLSSGVTVSSIPTKGRGVFASKDLQPGDIIGIDSSPFVCLDWINLDTYCSYCLQVCLTPVPCPSCCKVVYCGKLCRSKGLSEDHWLQCKIFPTLISSEIFGTPSLILMKCLRFYQLKEMVLKLAEEEVSSPEMAGCNRKGVYSSTSYQTLHHVHAASITKLEFPIQLQMLQKAVVVTSLLLDCGRFFLNDQFERVIPSQDDLILTGSVLYSLTLKFSANSMNFIDEKVMWKLGDGCSPTLGLLNHSCSANADHYPDGRTLFIIANRFIKAGEEVTIGYMADYIGTELKLRQSLLLDMFECKCEACTNGWPVKEYQPHMYCKCLNCSQPIKDNWFCKCCERKAKDGMYDKTELLSKQAKLEDTVSKLERIYELYWETLVFSENQVSFIWEAADELRKHLLEPCSILSTLTRLFRYSLYPPHGSVLCQSRGAEMRPIGATM